MTFYANKVIKMSSLFARKNKNIISDILRSMQSSTDFVPHFVRVADYFISFGIIGPIVVYLKMEFCSCIRKSV